MNYWNLDLSQLDSEEFLGSEPVDRGTWICIGRYCYGQENGGVIQGARQWKDRKWQQLTGVTYEEVRHQCALWWWEGDDLHMWGYDREREAEVVAKREGGRKGGKSRSETKTQASKNNGKAGGRRKTKAPSKLPDKAEPKLGTQAKPKDNPSLEPKLIPSKNPTEVSKEVSKEGTHSQTSSSSVCLGAHAVDKNGQPNVTSDTSDCPPCTLDQALSVANELAISAECAEAWWLAHDARGWLDTKGQPLIRWHSSLKAYGDTWRRKDQQQQRHEATSRSTKGNSRNHGTLNEGRASRYRNVGKLTGDE